MFIELVEIAQTQAIQWGGGKGYVFSHGSYKYHILLLVSTIGYHILRDLINNYKNVRCIIVSVHVFKNISTELN